MTTSAPPRPRPTKPGAADHFRHLILPAGIVSSGWPAVRETSAGIGIRYDEWQEELNRALLAKDADGLYAADTAVISICRQSGKTYDVAGVIFADAIIHPGTTTVWTAHRFKVARESFNEMRAWAKRPEMAPHIDYDDITTAAGNECIPFRNRSRIVFAARERGAIRGFTKVRRLVLDEAQILTSSAMSDLVPTTNQAENPQIILMGTPPKPSDPGEVFTDLRDSALAGDVDSLLYAECSADPDCDIDDWGAVAQANPSFPTRTSKRAVLRLRKLLTDDDDYRREGLGIWSPELQFEPVITAAQWSAVADLSSGPVGEPMFSLDLSPNRDGLAFAVAGESGHGGVHLEVVLHGSNPGEAWICHEAKRLQDEHGGHLAIVAGSPAASLEPALTKADVRVILVTFAEYVQSCGDLFDAVMQGTVRHLDQPELNLAVAGAERRWSGDAWSWARRTSATDITPLVAVTTARRAFLHAPKPAALSVW